MARQLFGIEKGIRLFGENANTGVDFLFGSSVPGATTDTDNAGVGSLYLQDNGQLWQKDTAGAGVDKWQRKATLDDLTSLKFRSEKVVAATTQVAPSSGSNINLATTPLTGDEAPTLLGADFAVDTHIIFGVGGTPKIMRVSNVAGDVITVVDMTNPDDNLSEGDNFIVSNYLPDTPNDQEKQVLVHFSGGAIIKIADFNWALADGISLNGSIVDRNGPVLGTDTLQVATEKLEGDAKDAATLSGVARGAINLGTFTGRAIQDNRTTKQALQDLEAALEARSQATGVTAQATVDQVLVDDIKAAKWIVHAFEEATPANIKSLEVMAVHNGTAAADATSVDNSVSAILKLGANFNLEISVDLSGAGAAQVMRLRAQSSTAGVTVTARRVEVY